MICFKKLHRKILLLISPEKKNFLRSSPVCALIDHAKKIHYNQIHFRIEIKCRSSERQRKKKQQSQTQITTTRNESYKKMMQNLV